ncbi:hypothetical protein [Actinomadura rudentiformis]|uniref:Uncharacterized protein n=1 Tax=Actinomadura rudentiformis TaxID=359158 RepID=A0A6H9YQ88_9ACTN|nr:hypothetical protein [Actinomadura rudentiformis]KAB2347298.1 hypothetical protein F8566_20000 [Actinomadura rudentiformis]
MNEPMTDKQLDAICERWAYIPPGEKPTITVTDTMRPGLMLNALGHVHDDVPALITEVKRLREQVKKLAAERRRTYDALTDQGRAAADASNDLEDGINFDLLAKNAEVAGLVDTLTNVRDERDRVAEKVKRVTALRDRWEATARNPSVYRHGGAEHAAALAASHLPDLRRALDGEKAVRS